MTTKTLVAVGLAVGVLAVLPLKFGTATRGNVHKKGTLAPAAQVVGGLAEKKKDLASLLAPIDWNDVAASEVQGPENPNKPQRRVE